ncbi:hypothetical protein RFF05_06270 [Bengtsoniella intestinalis]|uniref:hypothetical protein n=1 Tax=Bengtsoniella intestinalis TaxID=3073143 RepID=UPI00391F528D
MDGQLRYSYRYRFSFAPNAPRKILDAQRFLQTYQRFEDIETLDKLEGLFSITL